MNQITVYGMDPAAPPDLGDAALVVGAARHLSTVDGVAGAAERIVLGPLAPAIAAIRAHPGPVAVLASGDPGFFGIVRALRVAGLDPAVRPAVSTVAQTYARLGLPWEDAAVVSTHGRDPRTAINACRALRNVAVLTGPDCGPAQLGAALVGWDRVLVVAECLGTPAEWITRRTPAEAAAGTWADPNVVVVLDERRPAPDRPAWHNQPAAPPAGGWALPEDGYAHRDSMITKWEVRALVLARLRPALGSLVWDVGSGSGAVAVECAGHHAAVIAIDHDPDAGARITGNARAHGVDVRVVTGRAPDVYAGLPDPDAVFLGGGGRPALAGALERHPAAVVATFAAVDRMLVARDLLQAAGYRVDGVQLAASRLADLPGGGVRLAATNPVFVLAGARP
jgi:precorrin-6Y C5,15-methyltransferase (decarboxylating)